MYSARLQCYAVTRQPAGECCVLLVIRKLEIINRTNVVALYKVRKQCATRSNVNYSTCVQLQSEEHIC